MTVTLMLAPAPRSGRRAMLCVYGDMPRAGGRSARSRCPRCRFAAGQLSHPSAAGLGADCPLPLREEDTVTECHSTNVPCSCDTEPDWQGGSDEIAGGRIWSSQTLCRYTDQVTDGLKRMLLVLVVAWSMCFTSHEATILPTVSAMLL